MPDRILADARIAAAPDERERRVVWSIGIGLVVSTLFFTLLHHGFPQVLDVPSNAGIPWTDYPTMFILDLIPFVWPGFVFTTPGGGWASIGR
jgi:membrane protease YdiL (CAAX protease family)